jgi:rSAM/selenodomain-associated transferase 1
LNETAIVIMAKEPHPGKTKTRLSPPLTHLQAADLYAALLLDTIAMLAGLEGIDLAVAISPPESKKYFQRITPGETLLMSIEGVDIGDCLIQALGRLLDHGYRKVIALNADGPSLPIAYLHQAVESLDDRDIVLGEGHDGGYYLVGIKRLHSILFQDIAWSTRRVLAQTLDQVSRAGLSVSLTPVWYDIDTIQDLRRLKEELPTLPDDRLLHTRRALDGFGVV